MEAPDNLDLPGEVKECVLNGNTEADEVLREMVGHGATFLAMSIDIDHECQCRTQAVEYKFATRKRRTQAVDDRLKSLALKMARLVQCALDEALDSCGHEAVDVVATVKCWPKDGLVRVDNVYHRQCLLGLGDARDSLDIRSGG